MALKQLMAKKELDTRRKELQSFESRETELSEKAAELERREAVAIAALAEISETSTEEETVALEQEAESIESDREKLTGDVELLKQEKSALEAKITELETEINERSAEPEQRESGKEVKNMTRKYEPSEDRGRDLMEKRSVTIASDGVILPEYQAVDIKPTFNEVSTILDNVDIKVFNGGESFQQPYVKGYDIANYETEGGATVSDIDPTFGYATISKSKIVAYTEDSEELLKLPAANFDAEVVKGVTIACRKKLAKEILVGNGTTGHFVGIFDDGATAIDATTDLDFAEIDEDTLDTIIYSYGGDEDIEAASVLILNKKDLKAFAKLRDSNGRKIHEIVAKGNFGTIDGTPFIINSACKAISDGATSNQYCMAYGPLSNYTMAVFSDLSIARSTDYKFKEGMIAHRGVIFAGGNVSAANGFVRVKRT
jgi:HK97 family phage major capsid protein